MKWTISEQANWEVSSRMECEEERSIQAARYKVKRDALTETRALRQDGRD